VSASALEFHVNQAPLDNAVLVLTHHSLCSHLASVRSIKRTEIRSEPTTDEITFQQAWFLEIQW
jgi:hypothetical protein